MPKPQHQVQTVTRNRYKSHLTTLSGWHRKYRADEDVLLPIRHIHPSLINSYTGLSFGPAQGSYYTGRFSSSFVPWSDRRQRCDAASASLARDVIAGYWGIHPPLSLAQRFEVCKEPFIPVRLVRKIKESFATHSSPSSPRGLRIPRASAAAQQPEPGPATAAIL